MELHQSPATDSGYTKRRRPLTYNPQSEIVRAEHVPIVVGLSSATVWRLRRAGQFAPAIRLGENSIGFRRVDLEAWLASRQQAA